MYSVGDVIRFGATALVVAVSGLFGPAVALADDTEIYQAEANVSSTARPRVLIVFDDSGSMSFEVDQQRPPYDPTESYDNKFGSGRIYWSTDASTPSPGSNNWFNASSNRCASSYTLLDEEGQFTATRARRWVDSESVPGECGPLVCPSGTTLRNGGCFTRECRRSFLWWCIEWGPWEYDSAPTQECSDDYVQPGSWQALTASVKSPRHVECRDDEVQGIADNGSGVADGFPQNNVETGSEYGPSVDLSMDWGDESYTFFTSHYLDWLHDESLEEPRSRLEIAQDVVSAIIRTNPGIDFGLMEFNYDQGGRVVRRIIGNMSGDERDDLIGMVNQIDHAGSTPLCESMYEAYRYIAGESVLYGYEARSGGDNRGVYDVLSRDRAAESPSGQYDSPTTDCAYTYVILMTDGFPQRDTSANDAIRSLTGKTCDRYLDADDDWTTNCLPQLTEYMANTDLDGDSSNGNQFAITYTIGFTTDQKLLEDAANNGKGLYYTANDARELTEAFRGAITSILSTDTTFTSPAVAVDTFTRTQSRDEIFYAMFKPRDSVDWPGNIKKLRLSLSDGEAVLVDRNGSPALDPETGYIKDTAATFWGSSQDGGDVEKGGVGALLASRNPDTRSIYSDTGSNGALEAFTVDNLDASALGVASMSQVYSLFGAANESAFEKQVAWARGHDAYDSDGDNNTDEPRNWIMGDVLHSQPLVLNYGELGSFTEENPDLRLLVGTNAGFVHLFGGDDGQEDWAFFPKELIPILPQRRRNALSSDNIYGMDLTPTVYTRDNNGDGTLDASDGDKVWVYLGMRRGGSSYYALDLSNPASPALKWRIGNDTAGFSELAQSWSEPVVTRIPGYRDDDGVPKPVVIFGAGYDTDKDGSGVATADDSGRGIFVVDADTGALVWSVTPAGNSAANLSATGLLHSVAAPVTVVDSNGDELSDRIYFADTGGNVWRVDMPGNVLPTASQDTWQINKLASLAGGGTSSDRRFFNAPDVVRIRIAGTPVDAVLIGSGDRTNPNATDVNNRFYMLKDLQVAPYSTERPTSSECSEEGFSDFRCSLPLTEGQLFNITDNPLNTGTATEQEEALIALNAAGGWRIHLENSGEKSLAKSVTINGVVYFTTFTPNDLLSDINICEPLSGSGRLYTRNLFTGAGNIIPLGPIIPDTPSLHFGEDGKIRLLLPPGTPAGDADGDGEEDCTGGVCDINTTLPSPYGNYWFQEQY